MKIVADRIYPNETCYGLIEAPMIIPQPDGSRPSRWAQQLRVVRDDQLAYYVEDFGPAEHYETVTPLFLFGPATVAECQDEAARNRHDDHWHRRSKEMLAASTLIEDALRHWEQRRDMLLNRSVVGAAITVQRNVVPRQQILRQYKETRDARRGYTTH